MRPAKRHSRSSESWVTCIRDLVLSVRDHRPRVGTSIISWLTNSFVPLQSSEMQTVLQAAEEPRQHNKDQGGAGGSTWKHVQRTAAAHGAPQRHALIFKRDFRIPVEEHHVNKLIGKRSS